MSSYINNSNDTLSFGSFILSYVSLAVVAGLFTYRLINSFLDNIVLPLLDLSVLPERKFHKLTKVYDHRKREVNKPIKNSEYMYVIRPGLFLKELVMWCFIMLILYFIYRITKK